MFLERLMYLYLPIPSKIFKEGKEKLRLHGLSELQTLDGFVSTKIETANLNELDNFHILDAIVTDNESFCDIIKYLMSKNGQNLQETRLYIKPAVSFSLEEGSLLLRKIIACGNLHKLKISRLKISNFPVYEEHFLQSLVYLSLFKIKIDEDPIETLEKLSQLQSLKIGYSSYLGQDLICHEFWSSSTSKSPSIKIAQFTLLKGGLRRDA